MHPLFQSIVDAYATAGRPQFHQVTPAAARDMLRAAQAAAPKPTDLAPLASVHEEDLPAPQGTIRVRRYLPLGDVIGTAVYLHSGGWVIGDLDTGDSLCRRLAAASRCELISVDYRLAPEHPFPAPLDDAYAALKWAARLERPLLVIGESAGANLAAACAIRARDERGPRLVAQVLASPVTDHRFDTGSYRSIGDRNWLLSRADMQWFWDQYCPAGADRFHPLVSPMRLGDATGLPPTFLVVSELDPLRDEGLAYGELLRRDAVPVRIVEGKQMLHAHLNAAGRIPEVAQTVAEIAAWIQARVSTR